MRDAEWLTGAGFQNFSLRKKYVALNKELEDSSHAREAFLKFLLTELEVR
jgi:hypothetical protein